MTQDADRDLADRVRRAGLEQTFARYPADVTEAARGAEAAGKAVAGMTDPAVEPWSPLQAVSGAVSGAGR